MATHEVHNLQDSSNLKLIYMVINNYRSDLTAGEKRSFFLKPLNLLYLLLLECPTAVWQEEEYSDWYLLCNVHLLNIPVQDTQLPSHSAKNDTSSELQQITYCCGIRISLSKQYNLFSPHSEIKYTIHLQKLKTTASEALSSTSYFKVFSLVF